MLAAVLAFAFLPRAEAFAEEGAVESEAFAEEGAGEAETLAAAERDALAGEIRQRGIRRREFERFITTLESLPDQVTDFSDDLWGSNFDQWCPWRRWKVRICL